MKDFIRQPFYNELFKKLSGKINLIQVITGPRQVGKTTLALQIFDKWKGPKLYDSADELATPNVNWIEASWQKVRDKYEKTKSKSLLILDEVQKVPKWSNRVKSLFDSDNRFDRNIRVVILGSAALLMERELTESLSGRFEIHRPNQWSYDECKNLFKLSLNEYLYFGGYPRALPLRKDEARWAAYMRDSIIETVISKDVLLLSPVSKPALLRQTFGLAVSYPAQAISYQKMLGTLQDAGNTTTIASYLQLLSKAFLLIPLQRWSGSRIRQRGSIPKLIILDNGIVSSMGGYSFKTAQKDKSYWGRLVENAVGAQLYYLTARHGGELFYFQDRDKEIDYILKIGNRLIAIEVKSGTMTKTPNAFGVFANRYKNAEFVTISNSKTEKIELEKNINLRDFLLNPFKTLMH